MYNQKHLHSLIKFKTNFGGFSLFTYLSITNLVLPLILTLIAAILYHYDVTKASYPLFDFLFISSKVFVMVIYESNICEDWFSPLIIWFGDFIPPPSSKKTQEEIMNARVLGGSYHILDSFKVVMIGYIKILI